MYDLSVIIPARQEMFLALTVENILKNIRGNTEIIVVLDGAWADPGIPDNDRVTLIYNHESIGQRAATNQAVRMSRAKYVMKIDAHCTVDEGFDVKLMKDMQDDWTVVPTLYNLYGFDWVCPDGHKRYQGPSGPCKDCGKPTTRSIVWKPRLSRKSEFYRFDTTLHFQYHSDRKKHKDAQGQFPETFSLQGSCFMLTRNKYIELNICDEAFGSWGQQGTEIAVKTWLSGGKCITNRNTWYSHLFRTQGADFGFPYPLSGKQVDHARKFSQDLFFNNRYEKQIYPLSWLIEKFKPLPSWHEPAGAAVLAMVNEKGLAFTKSSSRIMDSVAKDTVSSSSNITSRQEMSSKTMSLPSLSSTNTISSKNIISETNQFQMSGITTKPIITEEMVKLGNISSDSQRKRSNKPSINESMDINSSSIVMEMPISIPSSSSPQPTSISVNKINFGEQTSNIMDTNIVNNKKTSFIHSNIIHEKSLSKGIIFYTDNQLNLHIAHRVQRQLRSIGLPIVSTSLKPMPKMGKNIVINRDRGYETLFIQILTALENSDSDIIYFCEHDNLVHKSRFEFTPPKKDVWYYNLNWWKIREDGVAAHWDAEQVSGICVYRDTAIKYYRERLKTFRAGNFDRKFEPMSGMGSVDYWAKYPDIDIRHTGTLTRSKWGLDDFRDKRTAKNFQLSTIDKIPGWDFSQGWLKPVALK